MRVLLLCMCALLASCGTSIRGHTVKKIEREIKGTITIPLPTPAGIVDTPISVDISNTEYSDEEAETQTESKMDPTVKAALIAIAAKSANAVAPGTGSIIDAFSNAWQQEPVNVGGKITMALLTAITSVIAVHKSNQASKAEAAKRDAVAFGKDALAVDPTNKDAVEALKEKHRLRQIAAKTNDDIKASL